MLDLRAAVDRMAGRLDSVDNLASRIDSMEVALRALPPPPPAAGVGSGGMAGGADETPSLSSYGGTSRSLERVRSTAARKNSVAAVGIRTRGVSVLVCCVELLGRCILAGLASGEVGCVLACWLGISRREFVGYY